MCGGGGAARRAAEAAQKEAERQAALERQRIADEAAKAKEEADRRYAEEQARQQAQYDQQVKDAAALRQQIADQEAFRLSEQTRIENERKAERDADLARQQKERDDAQAVAKQRADALSGYNAGRQQLVDSARGQIESAFGAFDPAYYDKYATDYVSAMKPQLDDQYNEARRKNVFTLANKGTLDSSAAARIFGRLDMTRANAEGDIAQKAKDAANAYRGSVDDQKSKLISGVFNAVNAAPVITADNVGDANSSLNALGSALNAPVSLAQSAAASFAPPGFGSLSSVFGTPNAAAPRTAYSGGGGANYGVGARATSGRLVA